MPLDIQGEIIKDSWIYRTRVQARGPAWSYNFGMLQTCIVLRTWDSAQKTFYDRGLGNYNAEFVKMKKKQQRRLRRRGQHIRKRMKRAYSNRSPWRCQMLFSSWRRETDIDWGLSNVEFTGYTVESSFGQIKFYIPLTLHWLYSEHLFSKLRIL